MGSDDKCLTHFGASLRNNKSSNHLEANNILHNRKGMPADWKTPEFTEGFQALRLQQGNDAMFKAKVDGDPRPEVTWTKNKKPLPTSDKYQLYHEESSGTVCLVIQNLGPGDEGAYCCTASNPYGSVSATMSINPDMCPGKGGIPQPDPDSLRGTLQRQRVLREQQNTLKRQKEMQEKQQHPVSHGL